MPTKQIGKGTTVSLDPTGSTTYVAQGLITSATPPPREREGADATALEDELMTEEPGQENVSEFVFRQFWHPGDTNHEIIDTLFGSKAKGAWRVVYPFTLAVTDTFLGWVKKIGPEEVVANSVMSREVTVSRTSAITRVVAES